jgi:hypothetical protein
MLDISIKALDKALTSKKKAFDFIKKHVKVVEKIDGTKLTLIRNDQPFDPKDYAKNWIVSYKGRIIYPTEFQGLESREEEVRSSSIGTSQYKFVHDHLRKVHAGTAGIPNDTEFFVEFVQNKPTVTRDYGAKHGMFLVGFGSTGYAESRGHVYSSAAFENTPELMHKYSSMLQLGEFPVIFEGNFSSPEEITKGCIDPTLKSQFQDGFAETDFSDPMSIVALVSSVFSNIQSSLGGQAEGVVMQVGGDDISSQELYKVLAADQHSKEVRGQKKARYKSASAEEEEMYKQEVSKISKDAVKQVHQGKLEDMFEDLSTIVYGMKEVPYHPVKSRINVQDDIYLMAKMGVLYAGTNDAEKIGIIPMAAKPFHTGHDALIKQSLADGCDATIVFLSTGGREEISSRDMIPLWRKVYLPGITKTYGEAVTIMFSDSPMLDAMKFAKNFVKEAGKDVAVYGGVDAEGTNEAQQRVDGIVGRFPELEGKIEAVGVDRSLTGGISGTQMRQYLSSGDRRSFVSNLPSWLSPEDRNAVWSSLSKGGNLTAESLIKKIVKEVLLRG